LQKGTVLWCVGGYAVIVISYFGRAINTAARGEY
jgi:hypothetical protein